MPQKKPSSEYSFTLRQKKLSCSEGNSTDSAPSLVETGLAV